MKFTVEDLPVGARSGRHHERVSPVVERVRVGTSKSTLMSKDAEWLLAAALLDSITDDLAVTFAAGWWRDYPNQMREKCAEAGALLRELTSDAVAMLADLVAGATRGRVQMRLGWMLRMARAKARRMRGRVLKMSVVQQKIRLVSTERKIRVEVRHADGRSTPEYQRARAVNRKAAGLCKTCPEPVLHGQTRCAECRRLHNLQEQERTRKIKNLPPGSVSLKSWLISEGTKLNLTYKGMLSRMERGAVTLPPVVYRSRTRVYVLPEKEGRAA